MLRGWRYPRSINQSLAWSKPDISQLGEDVEWLAIPRIHQAASSHLTKQKGMGWDGTLGWTVGYSSQLDGIHQQKDVFLAYNKYQKYTENLRWFQIHWNNWKELHLEKVIFQKVGSTEGGLQYLLACFAYNFFVSKCFVFFLTVFSESAKNSGLSY